MYSVHWTSGATNDLAALCLAYPNEWIAIDAAEQDIFDKLQRDPVHCSQAVSEGLRKIARRPLVIFFSINGNMVEVDSVAWIG
jgi:hypothetical protein